MKTELKICYKVDWFYGAKWGNFISINLKLNVLLVIFHIAVLVESGSRYLLEMHWILITE